MAFFVYILLCNYQTYYVGHTDSLEERIGQHISGKAVNILQSDYPLQSFLFKISLQEVKRLK